MTLNIYCTLKPDSIKITKCPFRGYKNHGRRIIDGPSWECTRKPQYLYARIILLWEKRVIRVPRWSDFPNRQQFFQQYLNTLTLIYCPILVKRGEVGWHGVLTKNDLALRISPGSNCRIWRNIFIWNEGTIFYSSNRTHVMFYFVSNNGKKSWKPVASGVLVKSHSDPAAIDIFTPMLLL